jgi:glucokinase
LKRFLTDVEVYPKVAAIAMAGPVKNNKLSMANARKWGVIDGD